MQVFKEKILVFIHALLPVKVVKLHGALLSLLNVSNLCVNLNIISIVNIPFSMHLQNGEQSGPVYPLILWGKQCHFGAPFQPKKFC